MRRRWPVGPKGTSWALVGLLEAPLLVLWVSTQFFGPNRLWLLGDFAVADHNARIAQHGEMVVGVYDRYGWHHPGPALPYIQGGAMWLFGSSARTLFAASILILAASITGCAALLITQCSVRAARFGLIGLGGFLVWMGTTTVGFASDSMGSLLSSPWNPDVVIAPCLLLVLMVPAARTKPWFLFGVTLVGSALVEADLGTAPLVAVCGVTAVALLLVGLRSDPAVRAAWSWRKVRVPLFVGLGGLGLLWVLPLAQQVGSAPHNLSAILDFFLHPPVEAGHGALGITYYWFEALRDYGAFRGAWVTSHLLIDLLGGLVLLGLLALVWRRTTSGSYARGLLISVGAGVVAAVAGINAINGPAIGYIMGWSMAVLCALVILGLMLLGDATQRSAAHRTRRLWGPSIVIGACALILAVQIGGGLGLGAYRDPAVRTGTSKVLATLGAHPGAVELRYEAPIVLDPYFIGVYFGVANALEREGIKVVLPPEEATHFGNGSYGLTKGAATPINAIRVLHIDPTDHATLQHPNLVPRIWVTIEQPAPGASVPAP